MVQIEVDGLWISLPIKEEMHVDDFIRIADKLEAMAGRPKPFESILAAPAAPLPSQRNRSPMIASHDSRMHDDNERKFAAVLEHLRSQVDRLERAERRLEQQEAHTQHILEYLQSLDKYIR